MEGGVPACGRLVYYAYILIVFPVRKRWRPKGGRDAVPLLQYWSVGKRNYILNFQWTVSAYMPRVNIQRDHAVHAFRWSDNLIDEIDCLNWFVFLFKSLQVGHIITGIWNPLNRMCVCMGTYPFGIKLVTITAILRCATLFAVVSTRRVQCVRHELSHGIFRKYSMRGINILSRWITRQT